MYVRLRRNGDILLQPADDSPAVFLYDAVKGVWMHFPGGFDCEGRRAEPPTPLKMIAALIAVYSQAPSDE